MQALPVAIHGTKRARLTDAERVQFDAILGTADDAVAACMNARRSPSALVAVSSSEAGGVLDALIKTVCAMTGAAMPETLDSKRDAVRWVSEAIKNRVDGAVYSATKQNLAPGMDPRHVATCMDLMENLNTLLGNGH